MRGWKVEILDQTSRDPLLALRLLRYMVRIWEGLLKEQPDLPGLPVILPVVLAQNAEVWQMEPKFSALLDVPPEQSGVFAPFIPDFTFRLIQLAGMPFEAIRGTPAGILILRTMKAERVSQLLHAAVWDESLFRQISREMFDLVQGCRRNCCGSIIFQSLRACSKWRCSVPLWRSLPNRSSLG